MYRPTRKSELKQIAKTRAVRETKQPYASEVEDHEAEQDQHQKPAETGDGGRRGRRPGS